MPKKQPVTNRIVTITASVALSLLAAWIIGFFIFMTLVITKKPDAPEKSTDVLVVLTGGSGRIEQGFTLMAEGKAKAMLITGVHPNVTLRQLVERWQADDIQRAAILTHCCIAIEHAAESTQANAVETGRWLLTSGVEDVSTLRIVTSNYHIPRARLQYSRALPGVTLYEWPVTSNGPQSPTFWRNMVIEYTKTLMTLAS